VWGQSVERDQVTQCGTADQPENKNQGQKRLLGECQNKREKKKIAGKNSEKDFAAKSGENGGALLKTRTSSTRDVRKSSNEFLEKREKMELGQPREKRPVFLKDNFKIRRGS